jgi:hypothetical protein
MCRASEPQDCVPAVGGTPKVSVPEMQTVRAKVSLRVCTANPQNGRQRLGRPEDCLCVEGLVGVSREKKAPSGAEIHCSLLQVSRCQAERDNRFGNRHSDEDTPTRNRVYCPLSCSRKPRVSANQIQTSQYFPTQLAVENCSPTIVAI